MFFFFFFDDDFKSVYATCENHTSLSDTKSYNIGEWSEIYAMLKLAADGKLVSANNIDLETDDTSSEITVLDVIRFDQGKRRDYLISKDGSLEINLYSDSKYEKSIPQAHFEQASEYLYDALKQYVDYKAPKGEKKDKGIKRTDLTFLDNFLAAINVEKIKQDSVHKADIQLGIHDTFTGQDKEVGYSVKSFIGAKPTLINSSGETRFKYELVGITEYDMNQVNAIDGRGSQIIDVQLKDGSIVKVSGKIKARFRKLQDIVEDFRFSHLNTEYSDNLQLLDFLMPDIVAKMLLYKFTKGENDVAKLTNMLAEDNPYNFHNSKAYEYKVKQMLYAHALGMKPGKVWDGYEEANGGYIIVKKEGGLVAFFLYDKNLFEKYLFEKTFLETPDPSKKKFDYGYVYAENGKFYIDLVLQVRFYDQDFVK